MPKMFDDEMLQSFMDWFYGYGDFTAPFWFIGMEEGGGKSFNEIDQRLKVWDTRERKVIEDLAEYHVALAEGLITVGEVKAAQDIINLFLPNNKNQKTWKRLIWLFYGLNGYTMPYENSEFAKEVKNFQKDKLSTLTKKYRILMAGG